MCKFTHRTHHDRTGHAGAFDTDLLPKDRKNCRAGAFGTLLLPEWTFQRQTGANNRLRVPVTVLLSQKWSIRASFAPGGHEISAGGEHSERFCSRRTENPVMREHLTHFCSRRYGLSASREHLTPFCSCRYGLSAGREHLTPFCSRRYGLSHVALLSIYRLHVNAEKLTNL